MFYGNLPLYPPQRGCERCGRARAPLYENDCRAMPKPPPVEECRRVTLENPCRPGERAEVLLGLDDCGNLMIYVRRDPRWESCDCPRRCRPESPCRCAPRRDICDRGCGPKLPARRDCGGYRLCEE